MDVLSLHVKLRQVSDLLSDSLQKCGVLDLNNELQCDHWEGIRSKLQGLRYADETTFWKEVEVLTTHHVTKTDMKLLRRQIESIVVKGVTLKGEPKVADGSVSKKQKIKVQPKLNQIPQF